MFGYVRPFVPQLRVYEHELYRAIYCGLCRSMGKNTGCLSRMTLSYDFVFLAIVRMVLTAPDDASAKSGPIYSMSRRRCIAHPFKKRPMLDSNDALDYCAGSCGILFYQKMRDDLSDNTGLKKLYLRLIYPFAAYVRGRVKHLSALDVTVSDAIQNLSNIELRKSQSADEGAQCFGELLGAICAYGIEDTAKHRIAYEIGLSLGRFIYIADAADDLTEDLKSGSYNPILAMYGDQADTPETKESLRCSLLLELERLSAALNLLEYHGCPEFEGIVQNIVCSGLPHRVSNILSGKKQKRLENDYPNPI